MLASHPGYAFAQDRSASPELEALIPDEAIDNAQEWAADGVPPEEPTPIDGPNPFPADAPELEPESPLADLPGLTIDWPDPLELAPVEQVEDDGTATFADDNPLQAGPLLIDPVVIDLTEQLALAFPSEPDAFPQMDDFVDQFTSLSTIEAYGDSETNVGQLGARAREDEELLAELLRVYGFYDGRIARSIGTSGAARGADNANPPRPTVRFDVIPGQRYRFGAIDLGALGNALRQQLPSAILLGEITADRRRLKQH